MQVKFRGKRVDGMGWITWQLFIPDKLLRNAYICPETNYANFAPTLQDGGNFEYEMTKGMSIGLFFEVEPSSIGMFTQLTDKHGKEIFGAIGENGGDIIKSSATGGELWLVCFGEYEYSIGYEDTESGYGFYFKIINDVIYSTFGAPDDGVTYEIIGNATDNQELLK